MHYVLTEYTHYYVRLAVRAYAWLPQSSPTFFLVFHRGPVERYDGSTLADSRLGGRHYRLYDAGVLGTRLYEHRGINSGVRALNLC